MAETEKLITLDNIKYIIGQFQAHFLAPFARRLSPGAKINGVLFDGYTDIAVPCHPERNIELTADCGVSIQFENSSNARMVMARNGLYFYDGSTLTPIIKVKKNSDNTYSITAPGIGTSTTASTTSSAKQIGFITDED